MNYFLGAALFNAIHYITITSEVFSEPTISVTRLHECFRYAIP